MTNSRRTSRGQVPGRGPAVEKHCLTLFFLTALLTRYNFYQDAGERILHHVHTENGYR